MSPPIRFERVTDETDCQQWKGHGSWPDSPYMGLSTYDKFFFIDPGPRRIVQEYSYSTHPSESICPKCGRKFYEHGQIVEYLYQGRSNIIMKSEVCYGDTIVKFDLHNYAVINGTKFDMTWEDWADLYRWKVWLFWVWVTSPFRALKKRFSKK